MSTQMSVSSVSLSLPSTYYLVSFGDVQATIVTSETPLPSALAIAPGSLGPVSMAVSSPSTVRERSFVFCSVLRIDAAIAIDIFISDSGFSRPLNHESTAGRKQSSSPAHRPSCFRQRVVRNPGLPQVRGKPQRQRLAFVATVAGTAIQRQYTCIRENVEIGPWVWIRMRRETLQHGKRPSDAHKLTFAPPPPAPRCASLQASTLLLALQIPCCEAHAPFLVRGAPPHPLPPCQLFEI